MAEPISAAPKATKVIFTVDEKELLCEPSYDAGKKADKEQKRISLLAKQDKKTFATDLADIFENGSEEATPDLWKAHSYKTKAGIKSDPPGPSLLRTDTFYRYHAWWITGIRLFFVRLGRILAKLGHAILPPFFSIFGLSYGIGFALDLFIVLKVTFIPKETKEKEANFKQELLKYGFWKRSWKRFVHLIERIREDSWKERWRRCKLIIRKDNRPYRMLNDGVWFLVNLIVLCTAGPLYLLLNPLLNLIGFSFDTGHEFFWLGRDTQRHVRLMNKLTMQIQEKNEDLKINPENQDLKDEIKKLQFMRDQIKVMRNEVIRRRLWISVCTALVLVGMVLIYFPPTSLPGAGGG